MPDFAVLNRAEERVLVARLESVRSAIAHAGEKGRDLELHVLRLLRDLLPAEYGLTTGFVAFESDDGIQLTGQLDLIIYDAIRYSPLIHLESCDVLPLEAVYGYVEVKASIRSPARSAKKPPHDSLDGIAKQNAAIRELRRRVFRNVLGGSPIEVETRVEHWLALRAYVVAFEATGNPDPGTFAQRMATSLSRQGTAHVHGILVPSYGFFYTKAVNPQGANPDDYFHVRYTTDHPLLAFKSVLLQGLASFQRAPQSWSAALDRYLQHRGQWKERAP